MFPLSIFFLSKEVWPVILTERTNGKWFYFNILKKKLYFIKVFTTDSETESKRKERDRERVWEWESESVC